MTLHSSGAMLQPILLDSQFEIHPCQIVSYDTHGDEIMEQCEEGNEDCWGLYLKLVPQNSSVDHHAIIGGVDWIEDFDTKEDAEKAQELLKRFAKGEFSISSRDCPVCGSGNVIEDDGADDPKAKGLQICMACGRSWYPHDRNTIFI